MMFFNWLDFAKDSLKRVSKTHLDMCINRDNSETKIKCLGLRCDLSDSNFTKYMDLSEEIEQSSKSVYFAMVKLTLTVFKVPEILTVLMNYFVYDLGDESYENIFIMCVNIAEISWTNKITFLSFWLF